MASTQAFNFVCCIDEGVAVIDQIVMEIAPRASRRTR